MRVLNAVMMTLGVLLASSAGRADEYRCGGLGNSFGPFDYRYEFGKSKYLVESAHFTPYIESLSRGRTALHVGSDIDYTLRAFPNHHRALLSMINLSNKEQKPKPAGSRYTVECWLDRAERFAPDDGMVKVLTATWLIREGRSAEAEAKLEEGLQQTPEGNANFDYALGLAYFDLKHYPEAMAAAERAYGAGFPLDGLRNKLIKAGKWQASAPKPATEPAQAPDAAGPAAAPPPPTN